MSILPSSAPTPLQEPPARCDLVVVGAGILGLAVARELMRRDPARTVCVLERERQVAAHQSSHNSGVIHAGIYYTPGSLKARLCVEGVRDLYAYCAEHAIPHKRSGKLIVASTRAELPRLDELERRGRANGVPGLRRLAAQEIPEIEPHVRGVAALHSPNTGVVDFAAVSRSLAEEVGAGGGVIAGGCAVSAVTAARSGICLTHGRGELEASHAIFCAGAWSDRLAVLAGADPDPRIVPFRGAYLRLLPSRAHPVRSMVYPVPDPSLPFLGVHLTRTIGGEVLLGPTALMAGARDAYALRRIRGEDLMSTLTWPGTWRMAAHWWKSGAGEIAHAAVPGLEARAAARFIPELGRRDAEPATAGVRAQAVGRGGHLVDDFVFSETPRALHVRNAPSPAATASLSIARHIVDRAEATFALH